MGVAVLLVEGGDYVPQVQLQDQLEQTDQQLREITANYYGEISFIDDGIGRIFETLEKPEKL